MNLLIECLTQFDLCHDITLMGTKSESVFLQLLAHIAMRTNESNVYWGLLPGTKTPDANCDYIKSPFIILSNGKVLKDKGHHPLHPMHCSTYDITIPELVKTLNKGPHPFEPKCSIIAICVYIILFSFYDTEVVAYPLVSRSVLGKTSHPWC